jgi:CTP:molybdopterin cytidylyltransferase MocA
MTAGMVSGVARRPEDLSAVVLAAGASRRLGRPKQLLPLEGVPLAQHALEQAVGTGAGEVIVVLGHRADRVAEALTLPPAARVVVNPDFARGQAGSLLAGLRAARAGALAAIVVLGDQPRLRAEAVEAVIAAWLAGAGPAVRAEYGGRPGHPVILGRELWPELQGLSGDRGARALLAARPAEVMGVEVGGEPPADVDTWDDYVRLGGA